MNFMKYRQKASFLTVVKSGTGVILLKIVSMSTKQRLDSFLYYIATFLVPSIPLFNLYNHNRVENHIVFSHVLILAGGGGIVGLVIFAVVRVIVKSMEGALLISIAGWSIFWLRGELSRVVFHYFNSRELTLLLLVFLVFIALFFRRYEPPFQKVRLVFNVLTLGIVAMFAVNLAPGVNHEILLRRSGTEMGGTQEAPYYIKRDFIIDPSLPSPDIYWFHMDGMMSLATFESFYEQSQEHLREELTKRGFLINEDATLNAAGTMIAMPALLSPAFYDSYYSERLLEVERLFGGYMHDAMAARLAQDGLTLVRNISPYLELPSALFSAGYEILHSRDTNEIHHTFRNLSGINRFFWAEEFGDLPELLTLVTPLNFATDVGTISHVTPGENPTARFVWMTFSYTHGSHWFHFDPNLTEYNRIYDAIRVYDLYPLAYEYAANTMLRHIDDVLEANPNAVIILQSDHGWHGRITQQFLLDQGYTLDRVFEMTHSVFSAVRIPKIYGGLDAPLDPKNISRELVNRFVGQNYDLLP